MFARMTVLPFKRELLEEGVQLYKQSVIPDAMKQKGYGGACLLIDRNSGKAISVTFWKSEQDAIANEESLYYQEQLLKFHPKYLSGPPIREGYEVRFKALEAPAKKKTTKKAKS
jgi:heme-degrading monooxygenase HmoA